MIDLSQRKVLIPVSSRLHSVDREQVQLISRYVITPGDALRLCASDKRWSLLRMDAVRGRVMVLTYNGVEVRLLFHRQVMEEVLEAGMPVPDQKIDDPSQEWLSINLLDDAEQKVEGRKYLLQIRELKKQVASMQQEMGALRLGHAKEINDMSQTILELEKNQKKGRKK